MRSFLSSELDSGGPSKWGITRLHKYSVSSDAIKTVSEGQQERQDVACGAAFTIEYEPHVAVVKVTASGDFAIAQASSHMQLAQRSHPTVIRVHSAHL